MTALRRALTLPALTLYGVGIIVGAGVYSVIGAAAGLAGEGLWLSFVLAAVVAFVTGLSYAELAATYPQAGAEYVYVGRAAPEHRWLAFGVGSILVAAGAATAATVAMAFAGYLAVFVPVPAFVAALALIAAATALNVLGIQQSSRVNIAFTTIEVGGLLLVVAVGLSTPGFGGALLAAPTAGLLPAAALIFFVYLGFEEIANLAEEAREPARDIPRAILLSLALTTGLYVLVAISVVALASVDELAASDSPLATALSRVSPSFAAVLGAIALFATANTVLVVLIAVSRMILAMARGRDLPPALATVLPGRRTPLIAALAALALAAILLPLGEIAVVASLSSLGSLVAFGAVNLSLVVLRARKPTRRRPFRVPLSVGPIPLPAAAGVLMIGVLLVQFEPLVYLIGGVVVVAVLVLGRARGLWAGGDR